MALWVQKQGGASDVLRYLQSPCANEGISGFTFLNAAQTEPFPNTDCSKFRQWESVTHRRRQTAGQVFGPKSKNVDIIYKSFKRTRISLQNSNVSYKLLQCYVITCKKIMRVTHFIYRHLSGNSRSF